jgi:hypothetical protein
MPAANIKAVAPFGIMILGSAPLARRACMFSGSRNLAVRIRDRQREIIPLNPVCAFRAAPRLPTEADFEIIPC